MTPASIIARGLLQNGSSSNVRLIVAIMLAAMILAVARWPLPSPSTPSAPKAMRAPAALSLPAARAPGLPMPNRLGDRGDLGPDAARLSNAALPIADTLPAIAAPYRFEGDALSRVRARDCLAIAALYEAGDDPPGERAVIQVILNRARHPAFPSGICSVVFQGAERASGCQFTFACDGALGRRTPALPALVRARAIADAALSGSVDPEVGLATHYHADYVVPRWRDELVKIARKGVHLFYRWPGYWGSPTALRQPGAAPEIAVPAIAALSPAHASENDAELEAPPYASSDGNRAFPVPDGALNATDRRTLAPTRDASAAAASVEFPLDPKAAPGAFALRALTLCGKSMDCRVAGRMGEALAFIYIRRDGAEGAFWDCARFQRADRAQCLPTGNALDRLLSAS